MAVLGCSNSAGVLFGFEAALIGGSDDFTEISITKEKRMMGDNLLGSTQGMRFISW